MSLLDGTVESVARRTINGLAPPEPAPTPPPSPQTNFLGGPISQLPGYEPPAPYAPAPMGPQGPLGAPPSYANPATDMYAQQLQHANPDFAGSGNPLESLGSIAATPFHITDELSALGGQAGRYLGSNVRVNPVGAGLGGDVGVTTPEQRQQTAKAGEFVGAQAPMIAAYAIAPEIGVPTTVLDAYFAAQGVGTVKDTIDAYNSGEISGLEALGKLAETAPAFLPIVLHGTGKLSEIAQSEKGQQIIGNVKEGIVHGERGEMQLPGGEPPKEPPLGAEGTQAPPESPAEDIRSVIVEKVKANEPLRESQAGPRREQLAEKAQRIAAVRADPTLSPAQRAAALGQAASGEAPKADFSPIQITPEQHVAAVEHVAANPDISEFDYLRIVGTRNFPGALTKLLEGTGLQKNEETLLIKAFGPEMADALQNRGTNSLSSNIQNAMTTTDPNTGSLAPGNFRQGADIAPIDYSQQGIENKIAGNVNRALGQAASGQSRLAWTKEARVAAKEREAILADMEKSIDQGVSKPYNERNAPTQTGENAISRSVNSAIDNYKPIRGNKLWRTTLEALGIPRALQTTADLSAALRQGITLAAGHPFRFSQSFVAQVKALFSHDFARAVQEDITTHTDYALAQKAKLENLSMDEKVLSKREEAFQSHLLNKIPGLRIITQASERAFLTFTNKLRHDVFYDQVARWREQGVDLTDQRLAKLATYLNNATGRGSLKWLGEHAATANAVFYSPRFLASRAQLIGDLLRPSQDPEVRKLVAKDLASFVGAGVTMLTLAKLGGADVQVDPRSTDFGKIRVGDTRIDFWAGFSPIARTVAQMATGEKAIEGSLGSGIEGRSRVHAFVQFLGNKLSPSAGLALKAAGMSYPDINQNLTGQVPFDREMFTKFNTDNPLIQNFVPLFFQDVLAAYQVSGPAALPLGAASALGVGVQGYEQSEKSTNANDKIIGDQNRIAMGYPDESKLYQSNLSKFQASGVLKGLDPSQYSSVAELKKAYLASKPDDPLTQASASKAFDNIPAVNVVSRQLSTQKLNFYREHPDQLVKDVESKVQSIANNVTLQRMYAAAKKKAAP